MKRKEREKRKQRAVRKEFKICRERERERTMQLIKKRS